MMQEREITGMMSLGRERTYSSIEGSLDLKIGALRIHPRFRRKKRSKWVDL